MEGDIFIDLECAHKKDLNSSNMTSPETEFIGKECQTDSEVLEKISFHAKQFPHYQCFHCKVS